MIHTVKLLSRVRLFVTLWTVACQAPLSMEFSRQEYWSGLLFPSPGNPLQYSCLGQFHGERSLTGYSPQDHRVGYDWTEWLSTLAHIHMNHFVIHLKLTHCKSTIIQFLKNDDFIIFQGCILSPCLFKLYAKYIMWNAGLDEAQAGIKIAGETSITSDMQTPPPSWQKAKN